LLLLLFQVFEGVPVPLNVCFPEKLVDELVNLFVVVGVADIVLELPREHLTLDTTVVAIVDQRFERNLIDVKALRTALVKHFLGAHGLCAIVPERA
jgi:hypothetical protein